MPIIRVEFFGIPRQRAGVAEGEIEADSLRAACRELSRLFPEFAAVCLNGDSLRPGFLASVNGQSFTTDPATPLKEGDSLLILSADLGG